VRLRSYFPCIENVDIWHYLRNSWRKNRFLTPFFERKHTIHRCLNGDFQFQCSNRPLLFDQKYKWHTFAVLFLIFVASVDPLSKNKSRIIIQKCWNFCKQLTLPGFGINLKEVIDRFIWTIELCHIWNFFKHFLAVLYS
jgi:hypothetical protein